MFLNYLSICYNNSPASGYQKMPIKFAPLHVPLERRLQTFAVLFHLLSISFAIPSIIIFSVYALFYTTYLRWIYIAYLIWANLIDDKTCERGSRPSKFIRGLKWQSTYADYYPINLVKLPWGEPDPKKNYLFCCFPHGVLATGAFTVFCSEARGVSKLFPNHNIYMHTLNLNFRLPFYRELFHWMGAVSSSAESLNYLLGRPGGGNMSALVVGGAQEAYYNKAGHYKLVLKERKGFVRIAIKNGSPLIPVIMFGEPDVVSQVEFEEGSTLDKLRTKVKSWIGILPLIPAGRGVFQYSFGVLPHRKPINIVLGEPLDVEKIEEPTQEQVDSLHQKFIEKLTEMFETQKKNFLKDSDNIHLEFI